MLVQRMIGKVDNRESWFIKAPERVKGWLGRKVEEGENEPKTEIKRKTPDIMRQKAT